MYWKPEVPVEVPVVGGVVNRWLLLMESVCRYDESPADRKPYRQKDGGLLAVGALSDKLKHTEPYKSSLELMLVQHVYPEFTSPAGHLRAKVRRCTLFARHIFCVIWKMHYRDASQ